MEVKTIYFERPGPENTDKTLEAAKKRAQELGIKYVVVATTSGETGAKAAEIFQGTGIEVIVVAHQYGFREAGKIELKKEFEEKIKNLGAKLLIGTDIFTMVPRAFRGKLGGDPLDIVSATLRMFCQGVKVCVEIAVMAANTGLVPVDQDIIAIAGTGSGADTAIVLKPADISRMFTDLKIKEIVAKPR